MGNDLDPNLFHWFMMNRPKAQMKISEFTLAIGASHPIARVKGQMGQLSFVQLVTETEDTAYLKIVLDGQTIFNHSHTMIEDDGSGKLSIPLLYDLSTLFGVTRTDAGGYGIAFNGKGEKLQFADSMDVSIINKGAATVNVNAYYCLYGIVSLHKVRKV